jgi:hypothetical protein
MSSLSLGTKAIRAMLADDPNLRRKMRAALALRGVAAQ